MLVLSRAVRRAVQTPLLLCDLPFGSTEVSDEQAVATAVRFVREGGADAVKIEGANPARLSRLRAIVEAGVPVVGHVGLTPQTATALGGLRAQGRTTDEAVRVAREALAVQAAGAFALVIEAVPAEVVSEIRRALDIPVIGIGAGAAEGQVLVMHDLLGITEGRSPVFVKTYAAVGDAMVEGVRAYAQEVRAGVFPGAEHVYRAAPEPLRRYGSSWTGAEGRPRPRSQPRVERLRLQRQHPEHGLVHAPQRLTGRHAAEGLEAEGYSRAASERFLPTSRSRSRSRFSGTV